MPKVSVIIPVYNAESFIGRAIDSVLGQSWTDLELLIVDDGSTDGTPGRLGAYGEQLQVFRQPNAGPAAARNLGLEAARGEYVAFLDADDWWEPRKLAAQVALLEKRPEIGFCSTATRVVDIAGRTVGDWSCQAYSGSLTEALFVNGALISGSTSGVLARRSLLDDAGGFDPTLCGFEDPDLWIRLSARSSYACIPKPLTVVVRTPCSVSTQLQNMRRASLASFRKNRHLLPPAMRGAHFRAACGGALTDYAKAAWRAGHRSLGLTWAAEALCRAPRERGRLALGLLLSMLGGQRL